MALLMAKEVAASMPGIQVVEQSTATPQGFAKAAFYDVNAVPTVFINGKRAFVGAPPSVEALRQAVKSY
jgi:protein-disulfide isomerase